MTHPESVHSALLYITRGDLQRRRRMKPGEGKKKTEERSTNLLSSHRPCMPLVWRQRWRGGGVGWWVETRLILATGKQVLMTGAGCRWCLGLVFTAQHRLLNQQRLSAVEPCKKGENRKPAAMCQIMEPRWSFSASEARKCSSIPAEPPDWP